MKILPLFIFIIAAAAPVHAQDQYEELDKSYAAAIKNGAFDDHLTLIDQLLSTNGQTFEGLSRAARGVWAAADLIYWRTVLENIERAKPQDVSDLLEAEAELSAEQGKVLIALGRRIWSYGEAAAALEPKRVEGYFYHAMGISFYALGKSILAALREGLRGKFDEAIDKSIEMEADFSGAAPLRTKGRSHFKLPWPLHDYKEAVQLAKHSVERAPQVSVNYLFLGDAYWKNGQEEQALNAWNKVIELGHGHEAVQHYLLENAKRKAMLANK